MEKISRVELITSFGDDSDEGIVYIQEIHVYNEFGDEINDNTYVNKYNHHSNVFLYPYEDREKLNNIYSEIATKLNVSEDIIDMLA